MNFTRITYFVGILCSLLAVREYMLKKPTEHTQARYERLEAPTFGIELSPDHISVAVCFANGSRWALSEWKPGYDLYELIMGWMQPRNLYYTASQVK